MKTKTLVAGAFGILSASNLVQAHTWVEQLMVLASNGTMIGEPGYARGNVLRSASDFSDPTMVNIIPVDGRPINEIFDTDLMCKSSQTTQTQTDGSPRLQAAPGSAVALRYQENGHVTLPDNQPGKPTNRGTVYVYGTTQPSATDSFLAIHRVWNADGTGGDGRGVLLSTQNFDDGQCYQVNSGTISTERQSTFKHASTSLMGADLWCQQDVQLPTDAADGQPYTLYWVWDWPTLPGTTGFPDGKQEIYTTCMDIDVTSDATDAQGQSFVTGQALESAGISSEMADIADPTAVTGSTIAFAAATGATSATATGATSGTATGATSGTVTVATSGTVSGATSSVQTGTSATPAYLSVHTTTTGSAKTTVSVASTTQVQQSAQSQSTQTQGGHRGGNRGTAITSQAAGASMATFTEFDSVFETVFQTIYSTALEKRNSTLAVPTPTDLPPSIFPIPPFFTRGLTSFPVATTQAPVADTESPKSTAIAKACSKTESVYRLKARSPFYIVPSGEVNGTGC